MFSSLNAAKKPLSVLLFLFVMSKGQTTLFCTGISFIKLISPVKFSTSSTELKANNWICYSSVSPFIFDSKTEYLGLFLTSSNTLHKYSPIIPNEII